MKKKATPIKDFSQDQKNAKEVIYKAMQEVHEEIREKEEKEEKEILLRKLIEVTQNKSITLSNYINH